jgi:polygalacturonase
LRWVSYLAALLLVGTIPASAATVPGQVGADAGSDREPAVSRVTLPSVPARKFNLREFGARGDGTTFDTAAIEQAIAAVAKAGGGTVVVPPGRYLTKPFQLASNLNLRLEAGATLLLSTDVADYALPDGKDRHCITAEQCHDIAVTGKGTIDGQGSAWWPRYKKSYVPPPGAPPLPHRPLMLFFQRCERVLVQDVTLTNSPMFHLVPQECVDVTVRNIRILAPRDSPNTDGLDPSGWNFLITGCTFDVGDDCIALKPTPHFRKHGPSCRNFLITHCRFLHGHGMSIGSQTAGGVADLTVRDCTFDGTGAGIRMKAARDRGGLVENLTYERLTIRHVNNPILIESYYPHYPKDLGKEPAEPVAALTPIWRHIRIEHVNISESPQAGHIVGLPEMPVEDITLSDVRISARRGLQVVHARGIRFAGSQIHAEKGDALIVQDADVSGIDPVTGN